VSVLKETVDKRNGICSSKDDDSNVASPGVKLFDTRG